MILELLRRLLTFGAGEGISDAGNGGDFFGDDDGDEDEGDEGDESGLEDTDEDESGLAEEDGPDDYFDEPEDEDGDDEDDIESEGDNSDPSGEGDGEGVRSREQIMMETSVTARLQMAAQQTNQGFGLDLGSQASIDELKAQVPELEGMKDDDIAAIAGVARVLSGNAAKAVVDQGINPIHTSQADAARHARVTASVAEFDRLYADREDGVDEVMAAIYHKYSDELGRAVADTISMEELYIMAGGTSSPKRRAKATPKQTARKQKRQALAAQGQAGRIATIRPGGKRKRGKDDEIREQTARHIRRTNFTPFTMD